MNFGHCVLGTVLLGLTSIADLSAAEAIKVPQGKPALLDGRCEAAEWGDAHTVSLGDGATLMIKQSGEFAWLCVKVARETWFGVDLFLAREGEPPLNLHASAKLGERRLRDGKWPDWQWWNNAGWSANVSRGVNFEKREFLPDTAREMQLRLSLLGNRPFQAMVQIHADKTITYPAAAKPEQPGNWMTFSFG